MNHIDIQHFILTRFNLLLWNKDKERKPVRTVKWLEHRFELFENYCLPSVKNQTCKNFEWIVLFDSSTPERFKNRITDFQKICPQLIPVFVDSKNGRWFAQVFRHEVTQRLRAKRVITSYLDNDDALNVRYVEDMQRRAQLLTNGTFVFYTEGYQFFTKYQYLLRINYRRNHFVSVVELGDPACVKTIYGYGSHYYIDRIKGAKIEYVKNFPMWCQVIHERNMGNDAYFLRVKMINDEETLRRDFAINKTVKHGVGLFMFRFLPRYVKTFVRRIGYKLFGRKW